MTEYGMKDSGARQEFDTGARRDEQKGKGRYDLISTEFNRRLAVVMEKGADKYGDRNWEKGMPLSRYYSSARRHLDQAFEGRVDEDHIIQCAFNVMAFMETLFKIETGLLDPDLDDRPKTLWQMANVEAWASEHPPLETLTLSSQPMERKYDSSVPNPEALEPLQDNVPEGMVRCWDGVIRPRSMPEGTPTQTPIYAQPAVFDPPKPGVPGGGGFDPLETGELA